MSYAVTYYCPRCGTLAEIEREGYLDDKSVTPYPLEGWRYVGPEDSFEDGDGVRFVCGDADDATTWLRPPTAENPEPTELGAASDEETADEFGCGEPFYLSFVRFENGTEIDPRGPSEQVELADDAGPDGPRSPNGPSGPDNHGGFYE
jgi:hypothetical protein